MPPPGIRNLFIHPQTKGACPHPQLFPRNMKTLKQPTFRTLAEALAVNSSTLHQWRKIDGSPRTRNPEEWLRWIETSGKGAGHRVSVERETLIVEKLQEEIERLKLANAESRRDTLPRDQVRKLFADTAKGQAVILKKTSSPAGQRNRRNGRRDNPRTPGPSRYRHLSGNATAGLGWSGRIGGLLMFAGWVISLWQHADRKTWMIHPRHPLEPTPWAVSKPPRQPAAIAGVYTLTLGRGAIGDPRALWRAVYRGNHREALMALFQAINRFLV